MNVVTRFIRSDVFRYLISGGCVTIGGTLLLTLLLHYCGTTTAYTATFIVSVIVNAVLQSRFVFRRTLRDRWPTVIGGLLVQYGLGLGCLHLLRDIAHVSRDWAPWCNLAICTPLNFLIARASFRLRDKDASHARP